VGNVISTMREAAPHVAVFHIADNPGRNDPGTGEMNYENIYKAIASFGYKGYVTMEYNPMGDQVASLTRATKAMRATLPA
jgi:hydroxypyruvate isomerase